jgi:hypothetical protein
VSVIDRGNLRGSRASGCVIDRGGGGDDVDAVVEAQI